MNTDIYQSRTFEMNTYVQTMSSIYRDSLTQNGMIFDLALQLTDDFANINTSSILDDSRILKVLRYCVTPSISQMKFGQFIGLTSTEIFEREKVTSPNRLMQLRSVCPKIIEFVSKYFDYSRFIWLSSKLSEKELLLAKTYAKNWTCSLIADQNAQTEYRNWRKTLQESRIEAELIRLGYIRSAYKGDVKNASDINIGSFSKERRVVGRSIQKADLVIHLKNGRGLVLVEAKAIGVEIDAYKRIKECCDKSTDWHGSSSLKVVDVVAVIAGFINLANIKTLEDAGVRVIWEHNLKKIEEIIPE
jgi:hypothetical protein